MPDIPYVPCPRQDKLHKMVRETPEFKQMMVEKKVELNFLILLNLIKYNSVAIRHIK
jgi:hypothetical protein